MTITNGLLILLHIHVLIKGTQLHISKNILVLVVQMLNNSRCFQRLRDATPPALVLQENILIQCADWVTKGSLLKELLLVLSVHVLVVIVVTYWYLAEVYLCRLELLHLLVLEVSVLYDDFLGVEVPQGFDYVAGFWLGVVGVSVIVLEVDFFSEEEVVAVNPKTQYILRRIESLIQEGKRINLISIIEVVFF